MQNRKRMNPLRVDNRTGEVIRAGERLLQKPVGLGKCSLECRAPRIRVAASAVEDRHVSQFRTKRLGNTGIDWRSNSLSDILSQSIL